MLQALNLPRSEVFFVDIGANIGTFTLAAAAAGYSVIAFEAMAINQAAVRASICANPGFADRITLIPSAVGRAAARCGVYTALNNALNGFVRCGDVGDTLILTPVRSK